MTIKDMIEDFMERSFDTISEAFCHTPKTMNNKITTENIINAFKSIDDKWETYEIDKKDWDIGHKLIYQYLGEVLIMKNHDVNCVAYMIKKLGELLYNNRNCLSMKYHFEHWRLEQMKKDFE